VTPAQCRAARALIRWTQDDLAEECGVSDETIRSFETGRTEPRGSSLEVLRETFHAAGVTFVDEDSRGGPGLQSTGFGWPAQCRVARGLLGWKTANLVEAAKISAPTVGKFEAEQTTPFRATLRKIRRAFEAAGIVFVEERGKVTCIRLRKGLR
jgi:transcriptional regulator with XRE-family HTH domain